MEHMSRTESESAPRDLRKTQPIINLTMRELMAMNTSPAIDAGTDAILATVDEKEWSQESPTVERPSNGANTVDTINPDYYKAKLPTGETLEVIQIIEAFGLDYHRASALKYLLRAGNKDDEMQDLKKCAWFVNRAMQARDKK